MPKTLLSLALLVACTPDPGPSADGAFAVTTLDVIVNELPARLYVPSLEPGTRAPLVVVNPGFMSGFADYEHFSTHFATWGFAVLALSYPDNGLEGIPHPQLAANVSQAIDWAVQHHEALVDPDRIVAAGHSMGGKIAIHAAADDPRIRAVVAWDPVDLGGPPCAIDATLCMRWSVAPERMGDVHVPLLLFGGASGLCAPAGENHEAYFAAATSDAVHVHFPGSYHLDWVATETIAPWCGRAGVTPFTEVHRIAKRTQIAWLRSVLFGERSLERFVDGDAALSDVEVGTVVIERR